MKMGSMEMLNYVYYYMVKDAEPEQRRKIDLALAGKLGSNGGEIIDDPDLPASIQGMEAPAWWNSDHDALADQHQLTGSDASFYGAM